MPAVSDIQGLVVVFLSVLSSICLIALFFTATFELLNDTNTGIIVILGVSAGLAANGLSQNLHHDFGLFCVFLAGLSGFVLFVKALVNKAHQRGGAILLAMFLVLGLIGWALISHT